MPVGGFPGIMSHRRRTTRAPINPIDKSTVVSIFPKEIKEVKATITPGIFSIKPGHYDNPTLLVVGPSSWWKEVDEEQPLLEIPCSSNQVADAIVKDYCNGMLGSNMTNSMPGLFWIPGEVTIEDLRTKYIVALNKARDKQNKFYEALIKFADTFWARTNGSPLCISDEMRLAARELGLENKEWMRDFVTMGKINCKACGAPVNPMYPVCGTCKAIIDPEKAKELNIQFAVS
jgi:hypothetical protein